MKTFIDKCLDNEESIENIERYVLDWVKRGMYTELYKFLGFKNIIHYKLFMNDRKFLYDYISKIKKWNILSEKQQDNLLNSLVTDISIYSALKEEDDGGEELDECGDIDYE